MPYLSREEFKRRLLEKRNKEENEKKDLETIIQKDNYYCHRSDQYYSVRLDKGTDHPLYLENGVIAAMKHYAEGVDDNVEKAKKVYSFIYKFGVNYGWSPGGIQRNAQRVWEEKKGVCTEMSFLYIILARSVGLKASYYSVTKDFKGKKVNHACAGVDLGYWKGTLFVDIAYRKFGIEHKRLKKRSDNDMFNKYEAVNGRAFDPGW